MFSMQSMYRNYRSRQNRFFSSSIYVMFVITFIHCQYDIDIFVNCDCNHGNSYPWLYMCLQCSNGHLMCASCMAHLLADGRLKDETATCPICRCEINRNVCIRNLAVEKAISELPSECQFCQEMFPRNSLDHHELNLCPERYVGRLLSPRCTYITLVRLSKKPFQHCWWYICMMWLLLYWDICVYKMTGSFIGGRLHHSRFWDDTLYSMDDTWLWSVKTCVLWFEEPG